MSDCLLRLERVKVTRLNPSTIYDATPMQIIFGA
jgi:hypothetical protein